VIERWSCDPGEVAASSPAVKSSESPGRKKPISRPVSANNTTKTPRAPNDVSRLCGSSGFSAVANETIAMGTGSSGVRVLAVFGHDLQN